MNGIIYRVTNTKSKEQRVYIGATKRKLSIRRSEHLSDARTSRIESPLYTDIRKYGEKAFIFEVVEEVGDNAELYEREAYWIDYYKSAENRIYNISSGYGSSGTKHTIEHRNRMSKNHTGDGNPNSKLDADTVAKIKLLLLEGSMDQKTIAEIYNINFRTVSHINVGRSWSSVKVRVIA